MSIPTEAGYYWVREGGGDWEVVELQNGAEWVAVMKENGHWPGACFDGESGWIVHVAGSSSQDYPVDASAISEWGPRLESPGIRPPSDDAVVLHTPTEDHGLVFFETPSVDCPRHGKQVDFSMSSHEYEKWTIEFGCAKCYAESLQKITREWSNGEWLK